MKSLLSWFVLIVSIAVIVSSCAESEEDKETTASTDNTTSSSDDSSDNSTSTSDNSSTTDTTAPTVSSISSTTDNQSKISVTDNISVTFSEAMDATSVTTNTSDTTCSGSLQFSSDNFSTCVKMSSLPTISNTNKTFTLSPSDNLSNYTSYKTIVTTAVKDSSGNTLSSQYESSSITTVNTEIRVVVIYPVDRQSYGWYMGGADNETFIKSAISRNNAIWESQDVGGNMTLAGHKSIDFSSYSSASSSGWKADLNSALMNHTDTSIHQELQDNLTSIMDEYSADCLIYWRAYGDNGSSASGASEIGADKNRCLMQLSYFSMGDTITFAHEFGHLQGCRHEYGYESPSPVTFTYIDNDTYTDYYRTIPYRLSKTQFRWAKWLHLESIIKWNLINFQLNLTNCANTESK